MAAKNLVAQDFVREGQDPVELVDRRRVTAELHQDVVALFALVDLVGQGTLAPTVDGSGCSPVSSNGFESPVKGDLDRLGVDGSVEHDHGFIGPHGHFPFPLVRLGRALRKTEQGMWYFPTHVGTTMLVD